MKSTVHSNVALSELKEGAIEELYQRALGQVLQNLDDPNTPSGKKAKRKIAITLEFTPTEDRTGCNVDVTVKTTLSPAKPVETFMSIKKDGEDILGFEPEQDRIAFGSSAN